MARLMPCDSMRKNRNPRALLSKRSRSWRARMIQMIPTTAVLAPAAAATPTAQRGPATLDTQPTKGAPMGVPP